MTAVLSRPMREYRRCGATLVAVGWPVRRVLAWCELAPIRQEEHVS